MRRRVAVHCGGAAAMPTLQIACPLTHDLSLLATPPAAPFQGCCCWASWRMRPTPRAGACISDAYSHWRLGEHPHNRAACGCASRRRSAGPHGAGRPPCRGCFLGGSCPKPVRRGSRCSRRRTDSARRLLKSQSVWTSASPSRAVQDTCCRPTRSRPRRQEPASG